MRERLPQPLMVIIQTAVVFLIVGVFATSISREVARLHLPARIALYRLRRALIAHDVDAVHRIADFRDSNNPYVLSILKSHHLKPRPGSVGESLRQLKRLSALGDTLDERIDNCVKDGSYASRWGDVSIVQVTETGDISGNGRSDFTFPSMTQFDISNGDTIFLRFEPSNKHWSFYIDSAQPITMPSCQGNAQIEASIKRALTGP